MSNSSSSVDARVLSVAQLSLSFGQHSVFQAISFDVKRGESLAIVGRSGSGKSSLLSCILGLQTPDAGSVSIDGTVIGTLPRRRLAQLRREKIGVVFQSGELLEELSPFENVVLTAMLGGHRASEARQAAREMLERLSIVQSDRVVGLYSGGERQRVAVARALVNRPRLILADEPTGSLDAETRDEMMELLMSVPNQFDCGIVLVTHDPIVSTACNRTMRLTDGALVDVAPRGPSGS
jgi:lipoprotein-releasing system ATP-binding protein